MAGTRSSTRQVTDNNTSPSSENGGGIKRKADDTTPTSASKSKRGRASKGENEGAQQTLEETMPGVIQDGEEEKDSHNERANAVKGDYKRPEDCWFWPDNATYDTSSGNKQSSKGAAKVEETKQVENASEGQGQDDEDKSDPEKALKDCRNNKGVNTLDEVKHVDNDPNKTSKRDEESEKDSEKFTADDQEDAVQEDSAREQSMPSNILEKGIIYFFTRGRVGVDDPDSVQDLARSYFVLRPMEPGAKLTDGAVQDSNRNRVFALPKKVWPKSGKDKFMVFVEQAQVSMSTLKEDFFSGSDYGTKTSGTRHTPGVTPIGEGVYAMTSTGGGQGTTHLAYMLTIPSEVGDVQKDMGLGSRGSFVISLKNPESGGPANAQLPQGPDWPKEFIEEFSGRGWMPAHPKFLDYANSQMLLIGEDFDSSNNLDAAPKDERNKEKETPQEELEKLEHEDDVRVEHLKGDDTIFEDLGISSKEYPKLMTTW
ncbi:hypothetical protein K431DRAFT_269444 [Polychaeton citri CBS 116435]|uniref:Uncharacterized protein n=1 Tax=Polychaeton citri CBS 116435 TaxID=1314669 RepID=A0A9P4UQF1_9PEZI|nr:hypothetical protein K431DRAFT_269444 [Polychaeton citri CBS 116435]